MKGFLILLALLPLGVSAQIFTEISYNPEGTDTKREWVEVYNNTNSSVDLSAYKFFEADVNHGITHWSGPTNIASGARGIIASDAQTLVNEFNLGGISVYDSVFSLNNTGELLQLIDPGGSVIDEVNYQSGWGADGDSNTLNLVNNNWTARAPSPGAPAADETNEPPATTSSSNSSSRTLAPITRVEKPDPTPQPVPEQNSNEPYLIVEIPDIVTAGEKFSLDATIENSDKKYEWQWLLGDGTIKDRDSISHVYELPGRYSIQIKTLDADFLHEHVIEVVPYNIEVAVESYRGIQYVKLTNAGASAIKMSSWNLYAGSARHELPSGLVLLPGTDFSQPISSNNAYPIIISDSEESFVLAENYPEEETTNSQSPINDDQDNEDEDKEKELDNDEDIEVAGDNLDFLDQARLRAEAEAYLQAQAGSTSAPRPVLSTRLDAREQELISERNNQLASVGASNIKSGDARSTPWLAYGGIFALLLGLAFSFMWREKLIGFRSEEDEYEIIERKD